jgi:hypothetical protein
MVNDLNFIKAETKLSQARAKEAKQELKKKQFEVKQKEKSNKKWQELKKVLSKPVTNKKVLKSYNPTLTIKEAKPEKYVPIYFQAELKEEKRKLFFE